MVGDVIAIFEGPAVPELRMYEYEDADADSDSDSDVESEEVEEI